MTSRVWRSAIRGSSAMHVGVSISWAAHGLSSVYTFRTCTLPWPQQARFRDMYAADVAADCEEQSCLPTCPDCEPIQCCLVHQICLGLCQSLWSSASFITVISTLTAQGANVATGK